jgi:predicted acyl esterase
MPLAAADRQDVAALHLGSWQDRQLDHRARNLAQIDAAGEWHLGQLLKGLA